MGWRVEMPPIRKPSLNDGPLKDLNEYLHELHGRVYYPAPARVAAAWKSGEEEGRYRRSKAQATVDAIFRSPGCPADGYALQELVEVLLVDFGDEDSVSEEVENARTRVRYLWRQAMDPQHPASEIVTAIRDRANAYLRLADMLEKAEQMEARGRSPKALLAAYFPADQLAEELLKSKDDMDKPFQSIMERYVETYFESERIKRG
ncbi:hypothetical protein [Streptomyces cinereoruber]|uniref:hypothetical protein n=1 Tax=Streptomyces cinereoruber TaxID=67260 RepID=UPI00362BEBDC